MRLAGSASQSSGSDSQADRVEQLGVAWDALEATLLLVHPKAGGELSPRILGVLGEVRHVAHAVQHALADHSNNDPNDPTSGGTSATSLLEERFGVLIDAVRQQMGVTPAVRESSTTLASPLHSPAILPAFVERRNIFDDRDLVRARRVQRETTQLDDLDADAKAAIVARGLAESDEEEEHGTTLGFNHHNPFGTTQRASDEVGYGSEADQAEEDEEVDAEAPDAVVSSRADEVDEQEEPTGIWRRQRIVRGSDPRGVNDWRQRAEHWEMDSEDEHDLAGPQGPLSQAQRTSTTPASAPASTLAAPGSRNSSAGGSGRIQVGDERVLLAAYAAPGGETSLTKGGRTTKARTQLKNALGQRWDDHQIESWATMLSRNPKRGALLAPHQRGIGLPAGGNPNLRPTNRGDAGPTTESTSSSSGGNKGKGKTRDQSDSSKPKAPPANERERRNKERRGNQTRKRGADRKAARTGVFAPG